MNIGNLNTGVIVGGVASLAAAATNYAVKVNSRIGLESIYDEKLNQLTTFWEGMGQQFCRGYDIDSQIGYLMCENARNEIVQSDLWSKQENKLLEATRIAFTPYYDARGDEDSAYKTLVITSLALTALSIAYIGYKTYKACQNR